MKYIILLLTILYLLYQTKENYYTFDNNCQNLSYKKCISKPRCGWLKLRYPDKGICVVGTAKGPLNPRLIPDAEEGFYKNIGLDFWTYYRPNNNFSCLYNNV